MGFKSLSSWDLDKLTWEGRVEVEGTVPVCVRYTGNEDYASWEKGKGTWGVERGVLVLFRMLESTPSYTSWALLRSGKHRNSKRGLAHVVVTGWKQGDWVAHWIEEMPLMKIVQK
nr:hypothetical protein [Tanacetum cinerariifolium]